MLVNTLPARRGLVWIRSGLALYRRNPVALGIAVILGMLLLAFFSVFIQPFVVAGLFLVARLVEAHQPIAPERIFRGLGANLRVLLFLGIVFYLFALLALFVSNGLNDTTVLNALRALQIPGADPQPHLKVLGLWLLRVAAVATPLFLFSALAPLFATQGRVSTGKSLFFSLIAVWRNFLPILICALSFFVLQNLIPTLLGLPFSLISQPLGASVIFAASFAMLPWAWCCFYIAACEIVPELRHAP